MPLSKDQELDLEVTQNTAHAYKRAIEELVPDGPDKIYMLQKLREVQMWAKMAIEQGKE